MTEEAWQLGGEAPVQSCVWEQGAGKGSAYVCEKDICPPSRQGPVNVMIYTLRINDLSTPVAYTHTQLVKQKRVSVKKKKVKKKKKTGSASSTDLGPSRRPEGE